MQVTYDGNGEATSVAIDGAPQFVMQQVRCSCQCVSATVPVSC